MYEFGYASNGPDFDTVLSRQSVTLDRFGKFDLRLALFQELQRPVQSSQLLAAHRRGPLRCLCLALL
jgi:hypothetical protein